MTPEAFEGDVARLRERPYRVGWKLGRTIYCTDTLIGMMDTPGYAALVVDSLNASYARGRAALEAGAEEPPPPVPQGAKERAFFERADEFFVLDRRGIDCEERDRAWTRAADAHVALRGPYTGEPKRGRGVEVILAEVLGDLHDPARGTRIREALDSYRAERAEAQECEKRAQSWGRNYKAALEREKELLHAHTALQSTHEALVQAVEREINWWAQFHPTCPASAGQIVRRFRAALGTEGGGG